MKVNYNFCGEIEVQLTGKEYSRLNTMKLKNRRRRIIQIFIEAISKSCMAYNNKKYLNHNQRISTMIKSNMIAITEQV